MHFSLQICEVIKPYLLQNKERGITLPHQFFPEINISEQINDNKQFVITSYTFLNEIKKVIYNIWRKLSADNIYLWLKKNVDDREI